jgi:O-antigen/teichoic acid export membrane protein
VLLIVIVAALFAGGVAIILRFPTVLNSDIWRFGPMIVALGIMAGGLNQMLSYIVTRFEGYGPGGNARILQGVAYCGSAISIGLVRPISVGVILADIVGKIAGATHILRFALRNGVTVFRPVGWRRIRAVARRYRAFALVSLPSGLISTFTTVLASFMLLNLYGGNVTGQFGLVERTATAAVNLVILALAQVFTSGLSERVRARDYVAARHLLRKTLLRISMLLVAPCAIGIVVAPKLFIVVFGAQWHLAGQICQIMAAFYFVSIVQGVAMYALMTLERQRVQFILESMRFCAVIAGWFTVWQLGLGPLLAIAIHFGTMSLFSLAFIWLTDRILTNQLPHPARSGA